MTAAAIDQQMPSNQKGFFIFKDLKNAESISIFPKESHLQLILLNQSLLDD